MNKVYRVIWSKTRNAYTVVSEIARTHGKSKTSKTLKALPLLVACFLGSGIFSDVNAYTYTNTTQTVDKVRNDSSDFVAENSSNITVTGDFSPYVGKVNTVPKYTTNETYNFYGHMGIRNLPTGVPASFANEIINAIKTKTWNQLNAQYAGLAIHVSNISSSRFDNFDDDSGGSDYSASEALQFNYENLSETEKNALDSWLNNVIANDDLAYDASTGHWYSKKLGYSVGWNSNDFVSGEDEWNISLSEFVKTDDAAVTLNNSTVTGKANSATSKAVNVTNGSMLSIAGNVDYGSLSVADSKVTVGGNAVIESGDLTSTGNSTVDVSKGTLTLNKGAVKMSKGGVLKAMVLRAPAATAESEIGSNTKIDGSLTVAGQIHGVTAGNAETDGANVSQTLVLENGINSVVTADGSNSIGQKQFKIDVEGKGKVASGDTGLINGDTLYNEVRPAEDGTYVTRDGTTAENISLLDEQVADNETSINNNAANISKLFDGEFSNVGQTAIKNLAKDAVTVSAGDHVNVKKTVDPSSGNADYKVSVIADGKVASGDSGLVTGDTVNKAINDALLQSDSDSSTVVNAKLANKADVDAGNIGNNMKNPDGSNASEVDKKANSEAWGNAIGTGKVEKGSKELVTGDTVNTAIDEVNSKIDGNKTYVDDELKKKANVDGSNIDKDKFSEAVAVGTVKEGDKRAVSGDTVNKAIENVTNNMNTELSNKADTDLGNISENGQKVIKNFAKDAVTVSAGDHVSVNKTIDSSSGNADYKVSVIADGKVAFGDSGLVTGDTVNKAINDALLQSNSDSSTVVNAKLANKADVNAGNIGNNLRNPDGSIASDADKKANSEAWGNAIGTGKVEKGSKELVTGDTVNTAIDKINSKIDDNKTYVDDELKKKANVDGSNIDRDKFSEEVAVGTVKEGDKRAVSGDTVNKAIENITNNMNTELSNKADTDLGNISENGQKVIQNLAKGSIDIVDGHNTKVSKNSVNGKDIYSIDVSDKDIIDAMKPEMDKKADKDEVNKKFGEVDKSLSNKADRDAGNLTEKDISSWQDKLGNGTIEKGNTGLINGNTAYEAVKELKDSNPVQSDGKIITIGAKDTASVVDFHNSDEKGRVLTGIVTDINDRSSAANAGYVQDTAKALQEQMNSGYSRLDKNISKAAAGSNALAALHPLDYDPEDKVNFAVGYGHYRDANAAAVGAFYYPNANMMLSVGATVGNGASGVNAGLSVKLGKGSPYAGVSKTKLAEAINKAGIHIVSLEKENAAMKQKNEALQERLDKQDKEITELKAMVSSLMNH